MAKKVNIMTKKDVTALESLKLADELLETFKKYQKQHKIEKEINSPPKWLLGRETLYNPKEDNDK
jgi:hypothetical protein